MTVQDTLLFLVILFTMTWLIMCLSSKEGFANPDAWKSNKAYRLQVKRLSERFAPTASAKRPVSETSESLIPEDQRSLVNFFALGCRSSGFIGPLPNGFFDPEPSILAAVQAGCRVFVLEIDYISDCTKTEYKPRLVLRDGQGKLSVDPSQQMLCPTTDGIYQVCDKINTYAFGSGTENRTDPVILVLYFLRQPPGSYKSQTVLDYYSEVAKSMEPLRSRFLKNEMEGGVYYRQKQEGRLLMNPITTYNEKVLVFSNANTMGFRENKTYSAEEDLDYAVNLRLSYTQTKLGVTDNESGGAYGILQTVEDYVTIPPDRKESVQEQTKLRWTLCLAKDQMVPTTKEQFMSVSTTFGVHCVPITLWDEKNDYMFTESTFKTFSFVPKPESLRFVRPPIITPATPSPLVDAKGGMLRTPTLS